MKFFTNKLVNSLLAIMVLGCVSLPANAASDTSYGYSNRYGKVTPTEVYSLVQNYDKLFIHYLQTHTNKSSKARTMKMKSIRGKTPEDVFVILEKFSKSLDKLARRAGLKTVPRIKRDQSKAIPAEVFLQAGNNLDSFVEYMDKKEPNNIWGQYYIVYKYGKSKSPSDVYALVDLQIRRLALVTR